MNITKMTTVNVTPEYDLRLSEYEQIIKVGMEKGLTDAIMLAFNTGWQRRENKIRNDARRAAHQH